MHTDEQVFNTAFDLGVKGYVLKDGAVTEIIKGIRAVAAGENYISSELSTFLVRRSPTGLPRSLKRNPRWLL